MSFSKISATVGTTRILINLDLGDVINITAFEINRSDDGGRTYL
jgi:hypothetical protein